MSDYCVTQCNRLNRELARLSRRHEELAHAYGLASEDAEDAVASWVAVDTIRDEMRKRIAKNCAPWFEVRAS